MKSIVKFGSAAAIIGTLSLAVAMPSEAHGVRRTSAAVGARAGAVMGAAAVTAANGFYYGPGYGYGYGYAPGPFGQGYSGQFGQGYSGQFGQGYSGQFGQGYYGYPGYGYGYQPGLFGFAPATGYGVPATTAFAGPLPGPVVGGPGFPKLGDVCWHVTDVDRGFGYYTTCPTPQAGAVRTPAGRRYK